MINEQLKTEFVKAVKNAPNDDRYIKIQLEVSEYLKERADEKVINFLLDNVQEAVKEINSTYFVGSINYGTTEDIKEVICGVTVICSDKQAGIKSGDSVHKIDQFSDIIHKIT